MIAVVVVLATILAMIAAWILLSGFNPFLTMAVWASLAIFIIILIGKV